MPESKQSGQPVPVEAPRRNWAETIIWLLVIIGLLVLVLQGTGYLQLFTWQGTTAAIALSIIGIAMFGAALYLSLIHI